MDGQRTILSEYPKKKNNVESSIEPPTAESYLPRAHAQGGKVIGRVVVVVVSTKIAISRDIGV